MTKAIKSSHPAFRLIGLDVCSLRASAPSLRAFTSSNIVPAGELWITRWILRVQLTHHLSSRSIQLMIILQPMESISEGMKGPDY